MSNIVVLVDDDIDDLELFCEAVLKVDSTRECITFGSCKELFTWFDSGERTPAFIFMDMVMPGMDGMECFRQIRKANFIIDCQLVAYSTFVNVNDERELNDLNVTILIKPSSFQELVTAIEKIFSEC